MGIHATACGVADKMDEPGTNYSCNRLRVLYHRDCGPPAGAHRRSFLLADYRTAAIASVQSVLSQLMWTAHGDNSKPETRFVLRREGEERGFCELILTQRHDMAGAHAVPLTPPITWGTRLRRGVRLTNADKEGLARVKSALQLLVESRQRRSAETKRPSLPIETHEGGEGRDVLLRTTLACNQKCPFCCVPATNRRMELTAIEAELDALGRRRGPRETLTISGGEPTVDPRLVQIIEAARRRGFHQFVLQTNGVLLERPGLLDRLIKLGVRRYMVSFHSHQPRLYDRITGSRGQFPQAVRCLRRLLHSTHCRVIINVVVNAWNYKDLPGLINFIGELCGRPSHRRRLVVCFSMINEIGLDKAPSWAVSLEAVAPHLRRAVVLCRRKGMRVSRSGSECTFPACLLPNPGRFAARRPIPQSHVHYIDNVSGGAELIGRVKPLACRRCPYDLGCPGVSARYARMFGLGTLHPPRGRRHRGKQHA
jgi:molybdenum cofactor biosynthesis enzyme MoaA